ncbi:MAG: hydrogenase [Nitrospiraceae bacterium]|nr:hydrogenase [Nitrospiraceae bacterium]
MFGKIFCNIIKSKRVLNERELEYKNPEEAAGGLVRRDIIPASFRGSVRIRQVDAGSCNACEWECIALTNPIYDVQRFGVDFVASPRHADIILVTGPVSWSMARALEKSWLAAAEPKIVIACGDCAADGGVFRGSYAVAGGADKIVPVAYKISGCPPSPADIIKGIRGALALLCGPHKGPEPK